MKPAKFTPVFVAPVTFETVRERLSYLEGLNAKGAGTAVKSQQFEIACLRELLVRLESRTVTDWIEHDGKWRPDSLSTDELVYLKTRKQELKIPYPAGKVLGWMHTGGDMDVMAYKLASPQARTVTVKLPRPGFVTISGERTAVYLKADVDAAMLAAGIEETE
ncbi:TPA: hypothetical protein ACGTY9_001873 [Klebsiella pneumoniae]